MKSFITLLMLTAAALVLSQEMSPSPSPAAGMEDFRGKHLILRNYTVGASLSQDEVINTEFKNKIISSDKLDYYDGVWTFDESGAKKNWLDLAILETRADYETLVGSESVTETASDLTLNVEHRGDVLNFAEKSGANMLSDLNKWVIINQYDIASGMESGLADSIENNLRPQIEQLSGFNKYLTFRPDAISNRLVTIGIFDSEQDANNFRDQEQSLISSSMADMLTFVEFDKGQIKDFFRKGMAEETASPSPLPSM